MLNDRLPLITVVKKMWEKIYPYYIKTKTNPLWLLMFLIGRFRIIRYLVTRFYQNYKIKIYHSDYSCFPDLKVDDVIGSLKQDGIYLGLRLPENILQEILSFAVSNFCYGDGKYNCGFFYAEKNQVLRHHGDFFVRGEYYNTAALCPAIKKLAHDPKLLEIATKYLGKNPVFTGSRLHWVFVANEAEYDLNKGAMNFHYDLNDYCSLRFFFYLTNVNLLSAPHVCIRSSHQRKKLAYLFSLFRRQSEAELLKYYGSENCLTVCGPTGFGFVEDVFCFHKATPPISSDRLLLQLQYALHDYGEQTDTVDPALLKRYSF
ncbi:MAG: hypothetical protein KME21_08090 [Desmonostoc vinosum HA7617-LM4]|jgi:hypothetical protein|nr:hypothetical protein [Desmonostoc vinosum HA7617-LM4]